MGATGLRIREVDINALALALTVNVRQTDQRLDPLKSNSFAFKLVSLAMGTWS